MIARQRIDGAAGRTGRCRRCPLVRLLRT
jgi:hypothetical protein